VALNLRDHPGNVRSAMRTKLEYLAGSLRACCGKFPPTESHNQAPLDGSDFGSKTLMRI